MVREVSAGCLSAAMPVLSFPFLVSDQPQCLSSLSQRLGVNCCKAYGQARSQFAASRPVLDRPESLPLLHIAAILPGPSLRGVTSGIWI